MASYVPAAQEKRELEKYIKFFTAKCVQIIVQSRLGQRICNKCKVLPSKDDWFNLMIDDNSEVSRETKKCVTDINPLSAFSVNVEISLKTKDGDTMALEVWTIGMDPFYRKPVKICYTVYQRLSRLVRSLVPAVRAVDGYKLSRDQSSDSYVICYQLYSGRPNPAPLSTHTKAPNTYSIGSVATPFGTVSLKSVCRSQLLFPPTNSNQMLNLNENYFTTEPLYDETDSPRIPKRHSSGDLDGPNADFEVVNFVPTGSPRFMATEHTDSPYTRHRQHRTGISNSDTVDSTASAVQFRTKDRIRQLGAFAPRRDSQASIEEDVPFSLYVELATESEVDLKFPFHSPPNSPAELVSRSIFDDPDFEMQKEEDFVYVGVKTPFAPPHSDCDIGRFQKVIQAAPALSKVGPTISETINDINFEELSKTAKEFDDFVALLEKINPNGGEHVRMMHGSPV